MHNSFWTKFINSGTSDVHTVALGNVHEIAHEENLQEENLEKQLGNALGTRTRMWQPVEPNPRWYHSTCTFGDSPLRKSSATITTQTEFEAEAAQRV